MTGPRDRQRPRCRRPERASRRRSLVNDLLDVSRIMTGNLRLDVDLVRTRARGRGGRRRHAARGGRQRRQALDDARRARRRRSRATPTGCSRSCGTCSRTPSSSRRAAARVDGAPQARRLARRDRRWTTPGMGIEPGVSAPHLRTLPAGRQLDRTRATAGWAWASSIVRHLVELHGGTVHAREPRRRAGDDLHREAAAQGRAAQRLATPNRSLRPQRPPRLW